MNSEEATVFELLKGVIDPELMVNIIDLGLIYDVKIIKSKIDIDLTLTSAGCPMGEMIIEDVKQLVESNYPSFEVNVNLVWSPVWTLACLTENGKTALGQG